MATEVRRQAEYAALRATIRERGTVRLIVMLVAIVAWAGTAVAAATAMTLALSELVPLLVLAAGFETGCALHTNVERIGRYLQVFHEPPGSWEHVTMEFGRRYADAASDPLFGPLYGLAVVLNFVPFLPGTSPVELVVSASAHLLLLNRIRVARRAAARQRALDLDRFRALADGADVPAPPPNDA